MSNFDYKYTCPKINEAINDCKSRIDDRVETLIGELNPLFAETQKEQAFRKEHVNLIYEDIENYFEDVRDCNSNIRDAAEKQIDAVAEERDDWRKLYEESQQRVDDLENEVKELQYTLNDYDS